MAAKRGGTALNKNRGSGFEDGYADPPMTPAEVETETLLYDPDRPFAGRIETAIQRFVDRRRMGNERSALFSKYLALGGIDTTQRQFTGTAQMLKDWKDEGFTKDEIRGFTANDFLGHGGDDPKGKFYNPEYPQHWDVDFAGVVAGFLGTYLPELSGPTSSEVRLAADTVLNFLKYIQHHNVCPEYRGNIAEAVRICELATTELPRVGATGRSMPGDFNLACRILFCCPPGSAIQTLNDFSPINATTPEFTMYEDKTNNELAAGEVVKVPGAIDAAFLAPANFDAERVFLTTLALQEPEMERAKQLRDRPIRVVNCYEDAYEVKGIVFAPEEFNAMYKASTAHDSALREIGPVGYVVLVPTIIEDGWDSHPTLEKGRNPGKPISLYLDHAVLGHLTVGMKLRLVICETDMGLEFIKECREALPSFHVFLPQTLMMHWKPPRLNDRLPPSADDPLREERQMEAEIEKDERGMIKEQRKVDPELDRQMREVEDGRALEKAMEKAKI